MSIAGKLKITLYLSDGRLEASRRRYSLSRDKKSLSVQKIETTFPDCPARNLAITMNEQLRIRMQQRAFQTPVM
jgi:hypothetical protein